MTDFGQYAMRADDSNQRPSSANASGQIGPKASKSRPFNNATRPPSQAFAQGLPGGLRAASTPSRPNRSDHRLSPPALASSNSNSMASSLPARSAVPRQRQPKLVDALRNQQRPNSALSFASISSEDDDRADFLDEYHEDPSPAEPEPPPRPPRQQPSRTMTNVLSAFSDAGKRTRDNNFRSGSMSSSNGSAGVAGGFHFASRPRPSLLPDDLEDDLDAEYIDDQVDDRVSSNTPTAPLKTRSRRGGVGEQGESSRVKKNTQNYPSTPAFREIERVLDTISQDWPMLILPEDENDNAVTKKTAANADDGFNPVPLALSLMGDPAREDRSGRSRLQSFLRVKQDLERALKSHIQLHYRAFDASVSAYNSTLVNMTSAQKEVVKLRNLLGDVKNVLGAKRTELANMRTRRDELSEMSRILDTVCAFVII